MKANVVDQKGKKSQTVVDLKKEVWDVPMNPDLVAQVVYVYNQNQRKGTAHTKTRSDVRGGGRKPWRQKGTGRARHGSIRSPIWVGGGVAFGPQAYKKVYSIPKKMNRLALRCVISDKAREKKLLVVDDIDWSAMAKTSNVQGMLESLKIDQEKVLLVIPSKLSQDTKLGKHAVRGARNLDTTRVRNAADVNVYDVVDAEWMIVVPDSVEEIEKRLA